MIERIFKAFFDKKTNKNRCLTVIRRNNEEKVDNKNTVLEPVETKTVLNNYFKNCVGLNLKEREQFYRAVFSANSQR